MKKIKSESDGQSLAEYALILSLISGIILLTLFNESFTCAIKTSYINVSFRLHLGTKGTDDSEAVFN